jgi:hypothetical protein
VANYENPRSCRSPNRDLKPVHPENEAAVLPFDSAVRPVLSVMSQRQAIAFHNH